MEAPKTPEAKRKANDKWDKENMATIGCKLRKQESIDFKAYAASRGKTSNTMIKEFVIECLSGARDNKNTEGD